MNVLTCYFQGKRISYIENSNTKKMTTFDVYERPVETDAKCQCENDGCQQLMSDFKKNAIHHFLNNSRSLKAIELGFSSLARAKEGASIYIKLIRFKELFHDCFRSKTFFVNYFHKFS